LALFRGWTLASALTLRGWWVGRTSCCHAACNPLATGEQLSVPLAAPLPPLWQCRAALRCKGSGDIVCHSTSLTPSEALTCPLCGGAWWTSHALSVPCIVLYVAAMAFATRPVPSHVAHLDVPFKVCLVHSYPDSYRLAHKLVTCANPPSSPLALLTPAADSTPVSTCRAVDTCGARNLRRTHQRR